MKTKIISLIIILISITNLQLYGQDKTEVSAERPKAFDNKILEQEIPLSNTETEEDLLLKKRIRYSILFGAPLSTLVYGMEVWDWGNHKTPKVAYEKWFAQSSYSGGADKPGHLFAHYIIIRGLYNIFDYTETNEKEKWFYSLGTSLLIGTMIEVGDAFTGQYGFSFEDMLADVFGIAIGALLEKYPIIDGFVSLSMEYQKTDGYEKRYNEFQEMYHFAADYSGMKFLINLKFAGFKNIGVDIPEFLRYIMLDIGYYSRGYTSYDAGYYSSKKRYLYLGISINFMEVVKDFFDNKDRTLCKALQQPFKYYHVPINMEHPYSLDN